MEQSEILKSCQNKHKRVAPFCLGATVYYFISAMKIWERHELLEVTVGYFNEELVSYETATTLVMVVAFLFPVLSLLEIILYLTYQKRV